MKECKTMKTATTNTDYDNEALSLFKLAKTVRNDMFALEDYELQGKFSAECQ